MNSDNLVGSLIIREVKVVYPCELGNVDDYPEKVVLKINEIDAVAPLDFGSLAYTERDQRLPMSSASLNVIKVNPDSFVPHRRKVLLALFDEIFCTKLAEDTLRAMYYRCRHLFNMLDSNGYQDAFLNSATARNAYEKYTVWLSIQIACDNLSCSTADQLQRLFKRLINGCFPTEGHFITQGVMSFPSKGGHHRVPSDAEVRSFAKITYSIGLTLTGFVVDGKSFPFLLEAGNFKKFIYPFNSRSVGGSPKLQDFVNRDDGNFESVESVNKRFPNSSSSQNKYLLKCVTQQIQKSNEDLRCTARIRMASVAVSAYTMLLQLITGISPSELIHVKYSDVVDPATNSIATELRSIKNRARGKKTSYSLGGKIGRRILIDYLRIRSWLLDGTHSDFLFIQPARNGAYTSAVGQLDKSFSNGAISRIRKILENEDLPYIGSSLGRKYKSLVLHELKVPSKVTAAILNHKESTNAADYSETTNDRSQAEFQNYWRSVREHASLILDGSNVSGGLQITSNSVGGCKAFNQPCSRFTSAPVAPDCTTQFGCLYCDKYVFHADAEDLHKLLSLKYVINEIRGCASDFQHANSLLQDLMIRIDHVIDRTSDISSRHKELVTQVNHRVFQLGDLTAFWEARLTRLEMAGAIIL
jgi:hypothetical protein